MSKLKLFSPRLTRWLVVLLMAVTGLTLWLRPSDRAAAQQRAQTPVAPRYVAQADILPEARGPQINQNKTLQQQAPQLQSPQALTENDRLQLHNLTVEKLHDRLQETLGKQLPLVRNPQQPWARLVIEPGGAKAPPVVITGNLKTGELRLAGRPDQVRSWKQIIEALDSPARGTQQTAMVTTSGKSDAKVRQVVNLLLAQNTQLNAENSDSPPNGDATNSNAASPGEQNPASALGSLLGPVQIEFIEGTRYLIIRGKPEDVARVEQIIQQIENLSEVAEPQITVFPLQHVESTAIARLVQSTFDSDTSGASLDRIYGSLLVVPLVKPNAVLLIGPQLSVGKASELIEKLDLPGKALTQFEVFRLKFADAERAQEVIENVFRTEEQEGLTTLSPKAVVIADSRTNAVIVRAGPRDMAEVKALIDEIDRPGGEAEVDIQIFKLRSSVATDLAPVIREALTGSNEVGDSDAAQRASAVLRLITIDEKGRQQLESGVFSNAQITADQNGNSLIVSAPRPALPLIAALIAELDKAPDNTAELKVFTINNGDAVSLAEMLETLLGAGEEGNQGEGSSPFQLRFSVDERTNSIIAAGSQDELILVEAILLRLDSSNARERENRVYKLKNANAEQVALALQDWLEGRRNVEGTAPGVVSPFQQIEREVVVVPEINSNSLIVSAAPEYYEELTKIIEQLDEQAPMVMIQVLIGEVRLGDADEFGVELGLQDSLLFDRGLLEDIDRSTNTTIVNDPGGGSTTFENQVIDSARFTPGFEFGDPSRALGNAGSAASLATASKVAAQSLSSFAVGRVSPDLGFGGLVLSASSESVSMLLRALQESRRLEVLSRPQIMALDNQTGRTFVGETVPIIQSTALDNFGRLQSFTTQVPVGLELLVRPRISPDGLVVMEVYAEKSELGPISQGLPISVAPNGDAIRVPRINQIQAETTISALDGQTVVLSGLLTKSDSALHRRVPLLADIPLLGDLFRYDTTSTVRSELLIILTPHIVRNRHEAEMLKQVESARMNWCLSDVVEWSGQSGLRSVEDTMGAANAETVYPSDLSPGESYMQGPPVENMPVGQPDMALPPTSYTP
ncbi:secretin N-terminal domain-containing protein [Adhaeretor mobilis]|uniref:Type II secretion system protein D n=1 Tax=Adhaeretor mobilis TaxID=1930276 RepID=A0A517MUN3_9BACT|nr:secretin N-terminal domain-containing protein [Adhaeretor mobilis]QDS98588.1 Type II secretion system protein D precursor [Adhaeretor mobilis]